jgi:2-amino-4-hydroxy-6-hydroxymethyldihydropteridine diphosphokinase
VDDAYVGIGSNLGDPVGNVSRAIEALSELGTIVSRSSLYRTKPWGKSDQPDFVNAVVLLRTRLEPQALLVKLKSLESRLGRMPSERWGPRIVDLDLLLYGDRVVADPNLHVPHPRLRERAFVLVPLAEIDSRYSSARDALPASELRGVVPL